MSHKLHIDLETYSSVPIKFGAQAYTSSPDFEILLLGYSFGGVQSVVVDLACGEQLPQWLVDALFDSAYCKSAWNATFEICCLNRHFGCRLPPEQWSDTMVKSLYCGYPAKLEAAGKALGLPEEQRKLSTGKALIRYFCVPCKPSKANGGRNRNLPHHDPERWRLFKEYNAQDVVAEADIDRRLSTFSMPDFVQRQWVTDLHINARGVAVDMDFVSGALELGDTVRRELTAEAVALSGLSNPNSVKQLTQWLTAETGEEVTTLRKEDVKELLTRDTNSGDVNRMLAIRQELGKTSTKKYDAIKNCRCPDGRVRGLLQYYGANRTGRWAGRLVQVQNLPRTYIEPLELAREVVKRRNLDGLKVIYGSPNDTLSQLIRTAFIAAEGNVLIDADFSAIEARVISWLADQEWRLEVFRTHGKIYEASASQMFGVPFERIKKGNPEYALRQRGKVAELALGYQGGVKAMRSMDTDKLLADLPDAEVQEIVDRWRGTNRKIVDLWDSFNAAAMQVISMGGSVRVRSCVFTREYDIAQQCPVMTILLPSGRKLYYVDPRIGQNRWKNPSIVYKGINDKNKWGDIETYGGKLVENCVQAIARDCLAESIERLEGAGFPVVFHVHDEVVIDICPGDTPPEELLKTVCSLMSQPIPWAPGLPLNAEGWIGKFFKKD